MKQRTQMNRKFSVGEVKNKKQTRRKKREKYTGRNL